MINIGNRYIPSAEDIAHMQQARKEAKTLINKLYKQNYSPNIKTL